MDAQNKLTQQVLAQCSAREPFKCVHSGCCTELTQLLHGIPATQPGPHVYVVVTE